MADQNTAAVGGNNGNSHYMSAQPIVLQQTDADMWRETAAAAGHGGIGGPVAMTYNQAAARNNGTAERLPGRRRIQEESKLLNYLMTDYDRKFIL